MKKKLALLMAAIMTVAMVPMTAFASTKLTAVDEILTAVDKKFTSTVELSKNDDQENVTTVYQEQGINAFDVELELTNGKFTKTNDVYDNNLAASNGKGVLKVVVESDTKATVTLNADIFNKLNGQDVKACVLDIQAKAVEAGDVVATFTSNVTNFKKASEVIAVASEGKIEIATEGVKTFVEDGPSTLTIKDITLTELTPQVILGGEIKLKLNGDFEFVDSGNNLTIDFLNQNIAGGRYSANNNVHVSDITDDTMTIHFDAAAVAALTNDNMRTKMTIGGIKLKATGDAGDVATITVSSLAKPKEFDAVKLEVAKIVEEAVTYTVEDKDLPTIYAGQYNEDTNTLKVSIEENTGDILNTSRKATFTFPEGIEIVDAEITGAADLSKLDENDFDIDANVLTIRNYGKTDDESDANNGKVDLDIKFVLNAAPTFDGDVKVTLGGEFDDVEFTVATVKAPYTIEAKTSEVLIDYRYVPVNEIVITEAEEGLLKKGDSIVLKVEKMEFEDAGSYEVTEGDIEVDVDIDAKGTLTIDVDDDSTEASTIVISGLELYLDRTLPVGGYALTNEIAKNILWENSSNVKKAADAGNADNENIWDRYYDQDGVFKYKAVEVNDSYVEVVTQARDQDDYTTNRKIVITIGATTMAVGTETVTLDAPAYINAENYTELPLRAVSEAFGATVAWDDASRTVTIMMGQRIVSMTIGSKTMYINGTPVAMNTAPEITADRTFVPVRDLANALGISKIDWNEAAATVTLN